MPDQTLPLSEVAQLPKVAQKTVYTMAQKGGVPAFNVRGQWPFKHADIDGWIESQKSVPHATRQDWPSRGGGEHGA